MAGYQARLLLLSVAGVLLIVAATFFVDWFVIDGTAGDARVDLRHVSVCATTCVTHPASALGGSYSLLATIAFWTALPLFVVIATQSGAKLLSGYAYPTLAKVGSVLGLVTLFSAFGAGFFAAPRDAPLPGVELVSIVRSWGPVLLMLGALAGTIAVRYAMSDGRRSDDADAYKPVVVPTREAARIPVTPISINKQPTPAAQPRPRAPSQPPAVARTTSPSGGIEVPPRARTSSSGPIDVSARLGATNLGPGIEVAIRQPPPEPPAVPADQIPVAPESGLVIRKRTPSAAPLEASALPLPPDIGLAIRTKPPSVAPPPMMPSVASALGVAPPSSLPAKVKYVVTSAVFTGAGIAAQRQDGLAKLIKWTDIVGIVARRLPQASPYDGTPFVDIVSSAGSTMRILPDTEITGHTLTGTPMERTRALVNLLAAQALDAKLDTATKVFATGTSNAPQLRDEKTLATHDERLA